MDVRRLTFVPFLPGGRCLVLPGPSLPGGRVRDGEHHLLDACLRIPRETVGFKPQRVHPFAAEGDHLFVWLDGDHAGPPSPGAVIVDGDELAGRLDLVRDALESFRTQSDAGYYEDNLRLIEPHYLRAATPEGGSGFGGDAARWRARREMIVDGIHRDGTFLDLGCANGLLMESVHDWAAERGHAVEPYGMDIAPGLVELARRRLPHWAGRIEAGNAIDYLPADRRRFTFVHVLLDVVPAARRADLVRHALDCLVEPGGRLLVSEYATTAGRTAAEILSELGFPAAGVARARDCAATTAWLSAGAPTSR